MSLTFLPGKPNDTVTSVCQRLWLDQTLLAYCSGNNLIIMSNELTKLQTLYLDEDCVSLDINATNGFIAVGFGNKTKIYKPMYQVMKNPKWVDCCEVFHDESKVNCVKWGNANELVIGSKYLSLWNIKDEFGDYRPVLLWTKLQPKPVYCCDISQDSQLIASYGKYEKTVKLWKRVSISGEENVFNVTLLKHDAPITALKWKRNSIDDDINRASQVLFTLCEDRQLRVWFCYKLDSCHTVDLWGSLTLSHRQRYCLIIDNWLLSYCSKNSKLRSIDRNTIVNSDVVLLADSEGNVEIHALDHLSNDPPRIMKKRLLHNKRLHKDSFVAKPDILYFSEVQPFTSKDNILSIVIHDLKGVIRHSTISLAELLDNDKEVIGTLEHKFTGHNKSIQKLIRSSDGEALLTTTRFSENCVWTPQYLGHGITLRMKNIISTESPIETAVVHEKGKLVIALLQNNKLQAWRCPNYDSKMSDTKLSTLEAELTLQKDKTVKPILMLNTPEEKHNHDRHFIAIFYDDGSINAFEVSERRGISEIRSQNLALDGREIHQLSTIDPVHRTFNANRPLLAVCTTGGTVITFRAKIDYEKLELSWIQAHEINTGGQKLRLVRGSSTGKMCIVDQSEKIMSLWDMRRGVLEYEEHFEEPILDIDWTNTVHHQSVVSIGFESHVILYTQLRYDYTNKTPSYLPIEDINVISHTAHKIGDSIWMKDGIFVVASGNQFYVKDKTLDTNDPFTHASIGSRMIFSNDLFHLSSVLNGPLPVYHPQFLIQALYANKLELVKELLLRLFLELRKLELNAKNIIDLDSTLNIEPYKFLYRLNKDYPKEIFPAPYQEFNEQVAGQLSEQLTKIALPYMTRHQQITLMTVITTVIELMKHQSTVDFNGLRFLLGTKLYQSHKKSQKSVLMRDVSWALHSDNKELLMSILGAQILSWQQARQYKIAYWAKQDDLLASFEKIAKYEFSKDDTRDPNRCAVFYLALKKKQVLSSLWRVCPGHPEQQKMMKFLGNDFKQSRWRTAALKNAFVLSSKHRYIEAASFFLLADSLKDSVNVICRQLKDIDLGIAVCRVYEGDNGPILAEFLTKEVLPTAIVDNDRWTTSYIYWKLRKQELAIKALITAPYDLEDNKQLVEENKVVNKSFLVEDPALLFLYNHLRNRNLRYFLASLDLSNEYERYLILRATEILCRMGCDYLAISLVKNWNFIDKPKVATKLPFSPIKDQTYSGINAMTEEPTSTNKVRKSLFDMFDKSGEDNTSLSSANNVTKSVLDDFNSNNNLRTSSILDQFKPSGGMNTNTDSLCTQEIEKNPDQQPKNLLDAFTSNNVPEGKDNDNKLTEKSVPNKPRSLLDDFETIPSTSVTNSSQNSVENKTVTEENVALRSEPPKVKNLLDDFM